MPFFEAALPARIMYGAKGGPQWSTAVVRSASGARSTNREWSAPLHRYSLQAAIESEGDFAVLRDFFMAVGGMADGFRFRDRADYKASQDNSALVHVTGEVWQMARVYRFGPRSVVRPIYKPAATPAPIIRRLSGTWATVPATVDTTTGLVTVAGSAPTDTMAWIGEFDVPVAFASDIFDSVIEDRQGDGQYLLRWPDIQIEEIRNPT